MINFLSGIPVLAYHRICGQTQSRYRDLYVSPQTFEKQIHYLAARGYNFLSVKEFLAVLSRGKPGAGKSILLTFDDGYEDNYTHALPILIKHKARAVVFVTADFTGKELTWNEENTRFLTMDQMKEMEKQGMEFGSHAFRHSSLPKLAQRELTDDIFASKQSLEKLLGHPIDSFSYPFGHYNESVKETVRKAGFSCAFSLHRGTNRKAADPYSLRRLKPSDTLFSLIRLLWTAPLMDLARNLKGR